MFEMGWIRRSFGNVSDDFQNIMEKFVDVDVDVDVDMF